MPNVSKITLFSMYLVQPYIAMLRWYRRARIAFNFTENQPKGLGKHLKTKRFEINEKNQDNDEKEAQSMLYVQYFPLPLIIGQVIYYLGVPADMVFLQSIDIMQYYLSGLACFNSYFTKEDQKKYLAMIASITLANCLPGAYNIIAPFILGIWNFINPFTNEKRHRFDNQNQRDQIKTYLRVQGLYTFLVVLLITLKFYHYSEVYAIEKKLKSMQDNNSNFFKGQIKHQDNKIVA